MGPEMTGETSATDALQFRAQQTTNAAAAEGRANFESAKAMGAGYLDQASSMASGVLASAQVSPLSWVSSTAAQYLMVREQSYLPGQGQQGPNTTDVEGSGVGSQLQSGAANAISTAKEYL